MSNTTAQVHCQHFCNVPQSCCRKRTTSFEQQIYLHQSAASRTADPSSSAPAVCSDVQRQHLRLPDCPMPSSGKIRLELLQNSGAQWLTAMQPTAPCRMTCTTQSGMLKGRQPPVGPRLGLACMHACSLACCCADTCQSDSFTTWQCCCCSSSFVSTVGEHCVQETWVRAFIPAGSTG